MNKFILRIVSIAVLLLDFIAGMSIILSGGIIPPALTVLLFVGIFGLMMSFF